MPNKALGATATLLPNGKVLLAGGGNSSTQLYDRLPTAGAIRAACPRSAPTTPLPFSGNGKVLIAGGIGTTAPPPAQPSFTTRNRNLRGDGQHDGGPRFPHGGDASQRQGADRRRQNGRLAKLYRCVFRRDIRPRNRNIHGYRFNDQAAVRASGGDL